VHNRNKTQIYRADDYSKHGYNQAVNKIHLTVQLMKGHEIHFMGNKFTFKRNDLIKYTVLLCLYNYP